MQTFAAFLWHKYNSCHLLNSGHILRLLCVALALTAREEKSQCHAVRRPLNRQKKKMKILRQRFLLCNERSAYGAAVPYLRGEPAFNGATLPLHLPARILKAADVYRGGSVRVTLHTSLQPRSSTSATADKSSSCVILQLWYTKGK